MTLAALEATLRGPLPPVQATLARRPRRPARPRRGAGRAARRGGLDADAVERRRGRRRRGARGRRCRAPPSRLPDGVRRAAAAGRPARRRAGRARPAAARPAQSSRRAWTATRWPRPSSDGARLMHVVATAGHVDHGKSTLVRALTGMEPDRLGRGAAARADDRARLRLDDAAVGRAARLRRRARARAVPRHDAGRGRPGARRAVRGRGRRGLDAAVGGAPGGARRPRRTARPARGDPRRPRRPRARPSGRRGARLAATSAWAGLPARGGERAHRRRGSTSCGRRWTGWSAALPAPDPGAPVRLWIDRAFSVRGSGTVVTGTLPAGTIAAGDELAASPEGRCGSGRWSA